MDGKQACLHHTIRFYELHVEISDCKGLQQQWENFHYQTAYNNYGLKLQCRPSLPLLTMRSDPVFIGKHSLNTWIIINAYGNSTQANMIQLNYKDYTHTIGIILDSWFLLWDHTDKLCKYSI